MEKAKQKSDRHEDRSSLTSVADGKEKATAVKALKGTAMVISEDESIIYLSTPPTS